MLRFVVIRFLKVLDGNEEHAFWLLVALVHDILPGYYDQAMQMLRIDMEVLDSFVKEHLPDILAKFQLASFPLQSLSMGWLQSVMQMVLADEAGLRAVDVALSEGPAALLGLALAHLTRLQAEIDVSMVEEPENAKTMVLLMDILSSLQFGDAADGRDDEGTPTRRLNGGKHTIEYSPKSPRKPSDPNDASPQLITPPPVTPPHTPGRISLPPPGIFTPIPVDSPSLNPKAAAGRSAEEEVNNFMKVAEDFSKRIAAELVAERGEAASLLEYYEEPMKAPPTPLWSLGCICGPTSTTHVE
mmetsp:Transcript_9555/g.16431  ORF Transcript_9555/g.16431 Transcript_9555/m.16431 type:complete len:300 (+) Transcript_9555:473-1372(+)